VEESYEVSLPLMASLRLYQWLRENSRERHFKGSRIIYPTRNGQAGSLTVILDDRTTALLLKLALA